jgi:hypothetical protein
MWSARLACDQKLETTLLDSVRGAMRAPHQNLLHSGLFPCARKGKARSHLLPFSDPR